MAKMIFVNLFAHFQTKNITATTLNTIASQIKHIWYYKVIHLAKPAKPIKARALFTPIFPYRLISGVIFANDHQTKGHFPNER